MFRFSWGVGIKKTLIYYYNREKITGYDIATFIESKEKPVNVKYTEFLTLFTDLKDDEENLYNKIDKQCRYEIRRAENKDNLTILQYDCKELNEEKIIDFSSFYNKFSREKGLHSKCDEHLMSIANKAKSLVITYAYQDETLLVSHVYLVGDDETRLWYSCSHYRNNDGQFRNLVGRANRYLHWKDILYFKERGCSVYDWGGISNREEIKNITAFKKEFGGSEITLYNYSEKKTFKAKLYSLLSKILKKG